jgi:hypothetical protein
MLDRPVISVEPQLPGKRWRPWAVGAGLIAVVGAALGPWTFSSSKPGLSPREWCNSGS